MQVEKLGATQSKFDSVQKKKKKKINKKKQNEY